MQQFQVTDHVRMKRNLRKIDTYGISPHILKNHRKTIFIIRKIHEDQTGQYALRVYSTCKILKAGRYEPYECEFNLAYFNPEMFIKVEDCNHGKESSKKGLFKRFA